MLTSVQASTETAVRTRLALIGTIGPLHAGPLRYDLPRLRRAVEELEPDLLGVEADPDAWASGDLDDSPLEVREALVPASRRTNAVVIPLGGVATHTFAAPEDGLLAGLRAGLLTVLDRLLAAVQRRLEGPEATSSPLFKHTCGLVCSIETMASTTASRSAWERSNTEILERLLSAVRRDPGRRVLVAVQCRRVHWLEQRLRTFQDQLQLVPLDRL
ncbi:MAG: hypothetical protein IT307_15515 [Chloroflexi bacterium]|nr:hypothetical protein [Chloroflexota bacterium]